MIRWKRASGAQDEGNVIAGPLENARLREAALAGVRAVAISRIGAELIGLSSTVVLARLLAPADFGRAAFALILVSFASVLAGESVGTPLIQRSNIHVSDVQTGVTLSLALGLLLATVTFLAAPAVSDLVDSETAGLLRLVSPVFLIAALGTVPHALLQRSLAFGKIAAAEVAAILTRATASVAMAVAGYGAASIIGGALVGSATFVALLFLAAPAKVGPGWTSGSARQLLGLGVPTALANFVNQVTRNLDYAILAAKLSPTQVGYYWRGYQLGVEYARKVTTVSTRMALPIFSRASSMDDMRRIRVRILGVNAIFVFGALSIFVAVAPSLVPGVFGPAWQPAVVPAQILALAGMADSTIVGAAAFVVAAGRPRALLVLSSFFLLIYGAAILLAVPHGITVVCLAAATAHVLRALVLHYVVLGRMLGVPMGDLRHELGPAVASSVALFVAAHIAMRLLDSLGAPSELIVFGAIVVGIAVFGAVLRIFFAASLRDVHDVIARIGPTRFTTDVGTTRGGH